MAERGSGDEEEGKGKVGLHSLFRFADAADALLMAAGAAGAVANGVSQPLMTLVFGEVVEAFGSASRHDVLHRVSEVRLLPMDYRVEAKRGKELLMELKSFFSYCTMFYRQLVRPSRIFRWF